MTFRIAALLLVFFTAFSEISAQESQTSYRAETFGSAATGNYTPFWIVNHTWGMVPLQATNFYLRGGVFHNQDLNRSWSFSLGLDVAGASSHVYDNPIWVQQAYGELNWKSLRLNLGFKEDYTSLLDKNLSSGDFDFSQNARPAPEIKISMPEFLLVPYTKGRLYIKGDFAVGKYLDGDYQERTASAWGRNNYLKNTLSHHKSLYFRIGNIEQENKLQFAFGMDNQAQWGGDIHRNGKIYHMANSFSDFMRVMIAKEGGGNSLFSDSSYVAGSQVGSYLLKLDYKVNSTDVMSLYWHHFFEDGSGMACENYPDMLLGLQYKSKQKKLFSGILAEYIFMKNQTGPIHFNLEMDDVHDNIRNNGNGMDDYYNNADYVQGRSYFGRSMGNPLLLSPEYNGDGRLNFKSNRILALHLGMEGFFHPELEYRLLATYAETLGRYSVPFVDLKSGIASGLDLIYHSSRFAGFDFKLSLAFNQGAFFKDNSWGTAMTITKRGIIGF